MRMKVVRDTSTRFFLAKEREVLGCEEIRAGCSAFSRASSADRGKADRRYIERERGWLFPI